MKNDAVLIQHVYTQTNMFGNAFIDMLKLTILRHMTYASGHKMDYWAFQGGLEKEHKMEAGAWAKIDLVKMALEQGYEYIFWVDADAVIMDFETDLRDAIKDHDIGACVHDPAKSDFLKQLGVKRHINVGVMYFRNTDKTRKFIDEWLGTYPGIPRWAEQGSFNNLLIKYPDTVIELDDKWNATVQVNMVEKPVVKGYHGITPSINRFNMMRADCIEDHIIYRV